MRLLITGSRTKAVYVDEGLREGKHRSSSCRCRLDLSTSGSGFTTCAHYRQSSLCSESHGFGLREDFRLATDDVCEPRIRPLVLSQTPPLQRFSNLNRAPDHDALVRVLIYFG